MVFKLEIVCGDVPIVNGGYFDQGNDNVGALRLIHCHENRKLNGPVYIFCTLSGQWTQPGTCNLGKLQTTHRKLTIEN